MALISAQVKQPKVNYKLKNGEMQFFSRGGLKFCQAEKPKNVDRIYSQAGTTLQNFTQIEQKLYGLCHGLEAACTNFFKLFQHGKTCVHPLDFSDYLLLKFKHGKHICHHLCNNFYSSK